MRLVSYYLGNRYLLEDGDITFSDSELAALESMVAKSESLKWSQIIISQDSIIVRVKSLSGAQLSLTTNTPLRENNDGYYSIPTDYGFYLIIDCSMAGLSA
jgi:hypothetical protein